MAEIDSLSIKLTSDATSAVSGLDKLSSTLEKLRTATKGGLGITSIANQVGKLADASNKVNGTTISNLKGLADAMQKLSSVGNIKISSSIANQITKINGALSGLNIGDGANKISELVSALRPLETLGKSSLSSTVNALNKLPEAIQKIDMRKLHGQVDALTRTFRPLAEEMQKIANGFNAFPSRIQRLIQDNERLVQSNNRTSTSYINLYAKLKMAYQSFKTIATNIAKVIKLSNDYIENLNLFNASMGKYAEEAQRYAEKVGEIMGIDPGEWMRNQGVFMTLATGFGVVSDRAYTMSKNLTQLGYDISSFFNISTEEAMLKLQSGLAGELEPLRRIGYDLSQARLQQEAYTLGIDKKIAKMTQAEKAELRYHAIMTQVTTAQGDMARTLNAPANQLRVFKAQVTMAGRALGNIFIPALNAVLPVAIAVVKAIRLVAESIANLVGFELPEVDYSGLNGMVSGADDLTSALDGASDSAKKLQQYTMGFDELNVIDPNKGKSDSGSGGVGGSGFDFELPEYDFLNGAVESRANEIFEKIKGRIGEVLTLVGLVGAGLLAWKIATSLFTSINTLINLLKTPVLTTPIAITAGIILSLTGFSIEFTGLKSAVENGLDGLNFAEIVGGGLLGAGGTAILGSIIVKWIYKTFTGSAVSKAIIAMGTNLGVGTASATGAILSASIGGIIAGIPAYFVGIYDACMNGLDWLNSVLIPAGATMAGAGIGAIIGALGGPVTAGIGALIGLAVGALTDLVLVVVENWGTIADWFDEKVISPVCNFFSGLWSTVSGYFSNLWDDIVSVWTTVSTWFDETVIQPVSTIFENVTNWIGTFFEGCWIIIQAVWIVASTWFDENVITPVSDFFSELKDDVSEYFSNLWEDIKEVWETASDWFDEKVVQPVKGYFATLWEDIKAVWNTVSTWFSENVIVPVQTAWETATTNIGEFFTTLWDSIKSGVVDAMNAVIGGIESAINWVIGGINTLIAGFNDIVSVASDIVGTEWSGLSEIPTITLSRITKFETGGYPETGQMFIAREAGAELVGNIGRKTAVVNNEQIVASVSRGVAEANSEQNSLLREQNSLLRSLLEKESGVYIDGKKVTASVEKHQRERGRTILVGGVG